jgi:ABC-type branched-subunit amino acid transport system ATPase component
MLEVKGIDVTFGHAKVLHDISLQLNQGEVVFIVGRNGAGKTTFLKTISGIMKPSKGAIVYNGEEIHGLSSTIIARKGVRYVAQDKKVFSHLTVRDNIQLAAYASGEDIHTAIRRVTEIHPKLNGLLDNKAGGLSGGEREILLIGRALVGDPKLFLIDEPTEGLAAVVIEDIYRILSQMKENNVSAFIVEQNLSIVNRLADRVYIMKEGKVIREFSKKDGMTDTKEIESYL